ncbi:hypothetical protein JKY79_01945 [Candidatus Babeliales bacterium]|nr:hypothetical protein [Candidatus Babeliales bacterium]
MKNKLFFISYVIISLLSVSNADACFSRFDVSNRSADFSDDSESGRLFRQESKDPFDVSFADSQKSRPNAVGGKMSDMFSSNLEGDEQDGEDDDEESGFNVSDLGELFKTITSCLVIYGGYKAYNFASNPDSQAGVIKNITRAAKEKLMSDPVVQQFTTEAGRAVLVDEITEKATKKALATFKADDSVKKLDALVVNVNGMFGTEKELDSLGDNKDQVEPKDLMVSPKKTMINEVQQLLSAVNSIMDQKVKDKVASEDGQEGKEEEGKEDDVEEDIVVKKFDLLLEKIGGKVAQSALNAIKRDPEVERFITEEGRAKVANDARNEAIYGWMPSVVRNYWAPNKIKA